MKHIQLMLLVTVAAGAGLSYRPADARAATCNITFSDSFGMVAMPEAQAIGFALSPYYNNRCAEIGFTFKVDQTGGTDYGHFHFWADDPTVTCTTTTPAWPDGVMGRRNGTTCVAVNPFTTSRLISTHTSDHWMRIRNLTASQQAWRATQILVKTDQPILVLIENTDGTFWQYTNLTKGTWNLFNNGKKAKTAWVRNQNLAAGQGISFDNFVVEGPI